MYKSWRIAFWLVVPAVLHSHFVLAAERVTNQDIIDLAQAGLSTAVLLEKVRSSPCGFDTSTGGLIQLKQAGVPDQVIEAITVATCDKKAAPDQVQDQVSGGDALKQTPGAERSPAEGSQIEIPPPRLRLISQGGESRFTLSYLDPGGDLGPRPYVVVAGTYFNSREKTCPTGELPRDLKGRYEQVTDSRFESFVRLTPYDERLLRWVVTGKNTIHGARTRGGAVETATQDIGGDGLITHSGVSVLAPPRSRRLPLEHPESDWRRLFVEVPDLPVGAGAIWLVREDYESSGFQIASEWRMQLAEVSEEAAVLKYEAIARRKGVPAPYDIVAVGGGQIIWRRGQPLSPGTASEIRVQNYEPVKKGSGQRPAGCLISRMQVVSQ